MPPRTNSSGMGERKKRTMSAIPLTSVGSTSSSSHRLAYQSDRSPSPPASAYFPLLSADSNARLRPTPDAESHFAYSTTLRRHQSEASALASPAHLANAVDAEARSLWSRAVSLVTGQRPEHQYAALDNGRASPPTQQRDPQAMTASAQFAHTTPEVSLHIIPTTWLGLMSSRILSPTSARHQSGACFIQTCQACGQHTAITNSQSKHPNQCSSSSLRQYTRAL